MLDAAKRRLLEAVPKLSPEQLTSLLEASFAYIGDSTPRFAHTRPIWISTPVVMLCSKIVFAREDHLLRSLVSINAELPSVRVTPHLLVKECPCEHICSRRITYGSVNVLVHCVKCLQSLRVQHTGVKRKH